MNGPDGARRFHAATAHLRESAKPEQLVTLLLGGYRRDAKGNRPRPVKAYVDAEAFGPAIELPDDVGSPADVVDRGELGRLLFLAAGVTRRSVSPTGVERLYRVAPSAGGMSPIEVYVAVGEGAVDGVLAGLHLYDPVGHALVPVRRGDVRADLMAATRVGGAGDVPVVVVLTGVPWKTCWHYRERGYRHLWWDAGTMLANLLTVAQADGIRTQLHTGFADAAVEAVVGIDGRVEQALAVVALGTGGPPAPPPGAGALPGARAALPWSSAPVEFPLVTEAHWSGRLAGTATPAAEVVEWSTTLLQAVAGDAPAGRVVPLPSPDPLTDVVLRRGSTRLMTPVAVPARLLLDCLLFSTQGIAFEGGSPGGLVEHAVVVHEVDGVMPGAYRWSGGLLTPVRQGDLRLEAALSCLDQHQAADAAFVHLSFVDLDSVLRRLGSRGYRVAQLAAGVASGRLHLAAFGAGAGATGLTFYDDRVQTLAGMEGSTCLLATAVGTPAYRARPGGPPRRPTLLSRGPMWARFDARTKEMRAQLEAVFGPPPTA